MNYICNTDALNAILALSDSEAFIIEEVQIVLNNVAAMTLNESSLASSTLIPFSYTLATSLTVFFANIILNECDKP